MSHALIPSQVGTIPRRGDIFPTLTGVAPDGSRRSTRDYYMRRNLAVIVVGASNGAVEWIYRAMDQRERAREEAGEILIVAPAGENTGDFPSIVDDGALTARLGLAARATPAVFVLDRYGVVFATNAGDSATPDLQPEDIPGWLEFIACRCS